MSDRQQQLPDRVIPAIIGALKDTIKQHGPITEAFVFSAAKRVRGQLRAVGVEGLSDGRDTPNPRRRLDAIQAQPATEGVVVGRAHGESDPEAVRRPVHGGHDPEAPDSEAQEALGREHGLPDTTTNPPACDPLPAPCNPDQSCYDMGGRQAYIDIVHIVERMKGKRDDGGWIDRVDLIEALRRRLHA